MTNGPKMAIFALAISLALSPFALGAAQARPLLQADGLTVETMAVEYVFAQRMTFRLVVRSDAAITSAVVFFRAGLAPVQSGVATLDKVGQVSEAGTAGTATQASYTCDLQDSTLLPFGTLAYWWEIGDATGRTSTVPSQTLDYVDNRFAWQGLADGILRTHWYHGDQAFGQSALDVAREALPRLNQDLAAPLPPRVDVYIYSSVEELQGALAAAGYPWQGGQARPELGVVLVAVSPSPDAVLSLRRELAHELTHLLVYQAAGSGYANVPRWLDEGLAVLAEDSPDPLVQATLEAAQRDDALFDLETLCAPFPVDSQAALLAYAQSHSVVQFIREKYGWAGLRSLLAAYADGATCSSGVERGLGVSLDSLESTWQASLGTGGAWQTRLGSIGAWVVLALLLLIVPIPLVWGKRKASP